MKSLKRIKTEKTFIGRRLTVEKVYYDKIHPMEHVIVKPVSVILPVTKDNKIILVNQVRTAVGDKTLYEIPAGVIDESDYLGPIRDEYVELQAAKRAAIRELKEETGYVSDVENVRYMFEAYTSPGFTDEKVYYFLVNNLSEKEKQQLDEDEDIEIHEVEVLEVMKMLRENEFKNLSTIAALQWYKGQIKSNVAF